jgi:hypothetical protein
MCSKVVFRFLVQNICLLFRCRISVIVPTNAKMNNTGKNDADSKDARLALMKHKRDR